MALFEKPTSVDNSTSNNIHCIVYSFALEA